ncbi:autophagy-related protein 16-like isoform X2 [Malaclemys terrapin pileata]|uniref:autophagy-related protein 16-like isoform X2 n=1 Tax=Malaclemys terrapin pileata TaxID=2991368 RepID=UPI0023A87A21|nr:autophagy-related protein 16-like isoform X2 [Malaclemys terrapin pileata]
MEGAGPGPAWRRHVRRELERRERETRRLQGLVQSHEKLLERRDLERLLVEKLQLEPGTQESRAPLELALLQQAVELAELRGAQEELAQSVAHLSDALKRSETECQEQRARAGRCARELAGLAGCCQELQAQLWEQGQEAEGLRAALGAALRARDQLEARWVQEKQLEAQRVNETNAREERYRDQLSRLRQKLERMQLGGTAGPGTELVTSENTSCEELAAVGLCPGGSSSPGRGGEMDGEGPDPAPGPAAELDRDAP